MKEPYVLCTNLVTEKLHTCPGDIQEDLVESKGLEDLLSG